ncbi:MAG: winged helix-turn-helix domain-containing protein [Methanocorpusculum sp.]|nr:winged helix-turn-helix domain-containing protein [Methanocorpusculum sp.]MDE2523199.1 winged helix-turn-helix domain-containing protein [Methanocorpusculum sp.]MDE2525063.1 winged helix-turn-helix domain-containing protein [Methanocorpusculum sp.]
MTKTELPKSSVKVLSVLDPYNSLTHKEIAQLTGLSPRTIRYALKKLMEHDMLVEKFNFRDARQILYSLKVPSAPLQATA